MQRSAVRGARSMAQGARALRRGGGGGGDLRMGHIEPPFYRFPAPKRALHEENELVWNDGVAPETCLDFDAPHVDKFTGLAWWLGGFVFFYANYKLMEKTGFLQNKKTAARELPLAAFEAEGSREGPGEPVEMRRSS